MPKEGKCKSILGELIRVVGRINYEYYKNENNNLTSLNFNDKYYEELGNKHTSINIIPHALDKFYQDMLDLIKSEVPFTANIVEDVQEIMLRVPTYSYDEIKKYNRLADAVVNYVNNEDQKIKEAARFNRM